MVTSVLSRSLPFLKDGLPPSSVRFRNYHRPDTFRCVFFITPTVCERHIFLSTRNNQSKKRTSTLVRPFFTHHALRSQTRAENLQMRHI